MKKNIFALVFWFLWLTAIAFAEEPATMVRKANRLYNKNDFDQALKLYNQAQSQAPERPEIDFDLGTAQYKKGDYQAAVDSFEKACVTKDKVLEAKALYNIGNSKYKMGLLKENTDLSQTVALLRESLDYYKRSIDLDPQDPDPKVNHELVEKQLKILLDKLKQLQENQKQQKSEKKEEKEQAQEDKKGEEKQAEQQEQKKAEEKQAEEKQAEEKQAQGQEQQEQKKAEEKQMEQGEKQEMTEQEAKMLLDSYRQDEDTQGKLRDTGNHQTQGADKDW
ncbi:MAG: tetratricopeptide repeat protein [Candidatus Omnitrophica bacterium]|nr:tetratricopeptide repeat protein [Candidatus Omnitrophota bacterium]